MGLAALFTRWPILRLIAILFSAAALIMLGAIFPVINGNDIFYGDGLETVYVALPWAGNCWTIIFHGAYLLTLLILGSPWHPGMDIAFDFIAWGLNWGMGIMLVIWTAFADDISIYCQRDSVYDEYDCRQMTAVTAVQYIGGILTVVVG